MNRIRRVVAFFRRSGIRLLLEGFALFDLLDFLDNQGPAMRI
jgi:hypothetical protein